VQKLLYAGIIVVGIVIVLSACRSGKRLQLQYLTALFRRLRRRTLRSLHLHGVDRCFPGGSCRARTPGAEEPARHDHRSLKRRDIMGRMRSLLIPGVDKMLLVKGRREIDAGTVTAGVSSLAAPASAR